MSGNLKFTPIMKNPLYAPSVKAPIGTAGATHVSRTKIYDKFKRCTTCEEWVPRFFNLLICPPVRTAKN